MSLNIYMQLNLMFQFDPHTITLFVVTVFKDGIPIGQPVISLSLKSIKLTCTYCYIYITTLQMVL